MKMDRVSSKGFIPVRDIEDIRYGNKTKLYQNPKTGHNYLCIEKMFTGKEEGDQLANETQRKMDNPNLYLVPIVDFDLNKHQQFCSSIYKFKAFVPKPKQDLKLEIQQRIVSDQPFSNQEITILMYSLIYGLAHLQELGYAHRKLAPEWVVSTTTGHAIMDPVWREEEELPDLGKKQDWFYSPEEYNFMKTFNLGKKRFDKFKSDVFTAGLILLKAGLLHKINDIYGDDKCKYILDALLNRHICELEYRYPRNQLLTSTVRKMLDINPDRRPNFTDMRRKLPDYSEIQAHFDAHGDCMPRESKIPLARAAMGSQNRIPNYFDLNEGRNFSPRSPHHSSFRRDPRSPPGKFLMSDGLGLMPIQPKNVPLELDSPLKAHMGFGPSRPIMKFNDTTGIIQDMVHKPQVPCLNDGKCIVSPAFQPINRNYNDTAHFGNDMRLNIEYVTPDAPMLEHKLSKENVYPISRQSSPYKKSVASQLPVSFITLGFIC